MAKKTLLEIVQSILSDLDSDVVNSISDTVEAGQVVEILEQTYYDLIVNEVIPEHYTLFQLTALGDTAKPNYLKMPTDMKQLLTFKYDVRQDGDTQPQWKDIKYLHPTHFLNKFITRNLDDTFTIEVEDFSGVSLLIDNDKDPEFWTSFDDEYIVCDSYNADVDASLQATKTMAYGSKEPVFTRDDDFVPDIDSNVFQLYINEAKTTAFINLKQQLNPRSAQLAKKQSVKLQNKKYRTEQANQPGRPDYGRR